MPLAQTPDTLRLQPWDRDQIHRLFDDLEFRVLRDRLFDTLAAVEPEVEEGFDVRGAALEPGTVAQWLAEHAGDGRRSGLAVVGTHLPHDGDATALAIAAADGDGGYIETATLTPDDDAALAAWLADAAKPKALHEAKLAIHDLAGRGWTLNGVTSDTALAAYLVRPGQRSFTLDDLSLRYLRRELRAETTEQQQLSLLDDIDGTDEQAVQTAILRARAVSGPGRCAGRRAGPHRLHRVAGGDGAAGSAGAGRHGGRRYRRRPGTARASCRANSATRSATPPRPRTP